MECDFVHVVVLGRGAVEVIVELLGREVEVGLEDGIGVVVYDLLQDIIEDAIEDALEMFLSMLKLSSKCLRMSSR
jgi:hypothetical protein